MASLVRVVQNSAVRRAVILHHNQQIRAISTSGKKRETVTLSEPADKTKTEVAATKKNWVSYGFDFASETDDKNAMHSTFFFSITILFVIGGFVWAYIPDYGMRDWAQREGFLELRRREQQGLPHISPNLISEDKIVLSLPSDEELAETEIII